jgi:hypothetical protein
VSGREEEIGGGLSALSVVGEDDMPRVENDGSIRNLALRFGELAGKLDVYEINGELVFYDHRRERQLMTGRVFRGWIEKFVFVCGGYDSKNGRPIPGSLQLSDSMDVLVAPDFRKGVRRIEMEENVRLPVIRPDGTLELLPEGHDAQTGVYTVPGGLEFPLDWDVAQGKAWISKWFGAMPFADDRSEAVLVAALLVLFVRHLPGGSALRPGFLFEANMAGSGKSICGKAACSIVLGFAPVGKRKQREEMDKEIEAHVRSKSPVIFLDNMKGSIRSATLDQLITSKVLTFRAMGGQSIVTLRNDAPVLVTGNDLEKDEDSFRRFLQCLLFETGDPNKRKVANLLDDDVLADPAWRMDALAALWSFISHWDAKGRPMGKTTLGSFEAFSRLMGGIVTACGYADPLERPSEHEGVSPEVADFRALCQGLYEEMHERGESKALFGYEECARVARALDIFGEMVGDYEHGKRATVKLEKLGNDERGAALDCGYLTQQELQVWSAFLKGKIGQEPKLDDGVQIRFGDRVTEKRRTKFTLEVI